MKVMEMKMKAMVMKMKGMVMEGGVEVKRLILAKVEVAAGRT